MFLFPRFPLLSLPRLPALSRRLPAALAGPVLAGLALALALSAAPAEAGSLRDRIKSRMQDRQAGRQQPASTAGTETVNLTVGGQERSYLVHVPASGLPARPGAVMVLHGGRGSGAKVMATSGMNAAADAGGFLAVYPNSLEARWNSGKSSAAGGPDDLAFLRAVAASLQSRYSVDPARIFGAGISSGASMLHYTACRSPGLLRAIAPISSNLSEDQRAVCSPGRGTPVMMFAGTEDPLMVYEGGPPKLKLIYKIDPDAGSTPMMSAPDTAAFWAGLGGCSSPSSTDLRDASSDGTTVTQISYRCSRSQVYLFRINGGGHSWPGSDTPNRKQAGRTSKDISATETMVRFFQVYGL